MASDYRLAAIFKCGQLPRFLRTRSRMTRGNRPGVRRRTSLGPFVGAVFLVFAWQFVPPAAGAQDWPQFLGPTRNGVYCGTGLAEAWPKEGPPRLWSKKVGQGFSGPVVAGGKLILFHRLADKETVECLNASNGTAIWQSDYPTHYRDDFGFDEGPRATPTIAGGQVFTFGAEGRLNCWKLATGEQVWSADAKQQFGAGKGFFGMVCSPLVEGNLVMLNLGGRDGAGIVAFDQANGKVVWKATEDEASYSSPIAATIEGERCGFFLTRSGLAALDPASGKVFFQYPWRPPMSASVSAATPLVIGDLIFLSASYGTGAILLRFNQAKPERVWAGDDILSNHYATSVHHDGFLYGFDGRQEQGCNLRCVELKTGQVRWSQDGFGAGTLLLAGEQLLVLTEKGELIRALASPKAFKPNGRAQILPFLARAYPALAEGLFYARSKDQLVCIDLRAPKKD